jgi:hypothetical protein
VKGCSNPPSPTGTSGVSARFGAPYFSCFASSSIGGGAFFGVSSLLMTMPMAKDVRSSNTPARPNPSLRRICSRSSGGW